MSLQKKEPLPENTSQCFYQQQTEPTISMSKPVTVKALLQYPEGLQLGCAPDVKRFKLSKDKAGEHDLYQHLQDTLLTVFPDIKGLTYSLSWKDDEGDLTEFCTQEELQMAIDAMTDHLLRIYVIVDFDQGTEETDSEAEDSSTHGLLKRATRRFRRRVRRRRRTGLGDCVVVSKEYRMGARLLIRRLHEMGKEEMKDVPKEGEAALSSLSPEMKEFIQQVNEEWHTKLTNMRPTVAARRMRMKKRTLPEGLERDHFLWLCRFMGRWHRRHSGLCKAMDPWSSGDTGDDSSADEETVLKKALKKTKKMKKRVKRVAKDKKQEGEAASGFEDADEEDTSDYKVSKEFRQGVRVMIRNIYKKSTTTTDKGDDKPATEEEKTTVAAVLTPDVQAFVQKVSEDWRAMLREKQPRVVAKRMRKKRGSLPAGVERVHYLWLCRFLNRWHRRNAEACSAMAGWSSGDGDEVYSQEGGETADKGEKKKGKQKGEKKGKSASSNSSDSEDEQAKQVVAKEFVKATRVLVRQFHRKNQDTKEGKQHDEDEQTTLAAMPAEVQTFVKTFVEEWDVMLAVKTPRVVARRMRKKSRPTLPTGVEQKEIRFLGRFLARWHGKHAVRCAAMGAWSSDESGEASVDERSPVRKPQSPAHTKEKGQ